MFFIGIFGMQQGNKQLPNTTNVICPNCHSMSQYEVYKTYTYFHIFFIPTFRWNTKYIVKARCCNTLYELDPDVGHAYESNESVSIRESDLHVMHQGIREHTCPHCDKTVDGSFRFCPTAARKSKTIPHIQANPGYGV